MGCPLSWTNSEKFSGLRIPLKDEYKFTIGGDGIARVWAADQGRAWVGAPDIVAYAKGKLTLADLKTSVKPYSRYFPKDAEKGSQEWRDLFTGNIKFKKDIKTTSCLRSWDCSRH
jgi:hypothetical protein